MISESDSRMRQSLKCDYIEIPTFSNAHYTVNGQRPFLFRSVLQEELSQFPFMEVNYYFTMFLET